MSAAVIIPARYGSTRFPGKALMRDPSGRPLLQYVWEAARAANGVRRVLVATDDERIAEAARGFGAEARMTSSEHACGSDRCAEAAETLQEDVIVNLQGDEPGISPGAVARTIQLLDEDADCVMATLARPIADADELKDPNVVKVVVDASSQALYFSRAVIPHVRGSAEFLADSPLPHLAHFGVYAFRRDFLLEFRRLGPHPLEEAEKLEQLRALAHGYKIKVGVTEERSLKVDTPEDFERFREAARRRPKPDAAEQP